MPFRVSLSSFLVAMPPKHLSDLLPCANAVWRTPQFEFVVAGGVEKKVSPMNNLLRIEGFSKKSNSVRVKVGPLRREINVQAGLSGCEGARYLAREITRLFGAECDHFCLKGSSELDGAVLISSDPDWSLAGEVPGWVLSRSDLKYGSRFYSFLELGALGLNFGARGGTTSIEVFILSTNVSGYHAVTGVSGPSAIAGMEGRIFLPAQNADREKILLAHELAHALTRLGHPAGGLVGWPPERQLLDRHRDLILDKRKDMLTRVEHLTAAHRCDHLASPLGTAPFVSSLQTLRGLDERGLIEAAVELEGETKYYALRLLVAKNKHQIVIDFIREGTDRTRLGLFALSVESAPNWKAQIDELLRGQELEEDQAVGVQTLKRLLMLQDEWKDQGRPLALLLRELRRGYDPHLPGFAPWDSIFGGHPSAVWAGTELAAMFPDQALTKWRELGELGDMESISPAFVQPLPRPLRGSI